MGLFRSTRTDKSERLGLPERAELLVGEALAAEVEAGLAGTGFGDGDVVEHRQSSCEGVGGLMY